LGDASGVGVAVTDAMGVGVLLSNGLGADIPRVGASWTPPRLWFRTLPEFPFRSETLPRCGVINVVEAKADANTAAYEGALCGNRARGMRPAWTSPVLYIAEQ
jgi:hypothetical protein